MEANGAYSQWNYDANGRLLSSSSRDADGVGTESIYDSCGRLVRQNSFTIDQPPARYEWDYGADGLLHRSVGPLGCVETSYEVDGQGNPTSIDEQPQCGTPLRTGLVRYGGSEIEVDTLSADGGVLWCKEFDFYPDGHVSRIQEPCQMGAVDEYDERGNPTHHEGGGSVMDWSWDDLNQLVYQRRDDGSITTSALLTYQGRCLVRIFVESWGPDTSPSSSATDYSCEYLAPNVLVHSQVLRNGSLLRLERTTFDDLGRKLQDELPLPDGGWTTTDTWTYDCNPPPPG